MTNHRFAVLDGLRGVAAGVVLAFHLVQQHDLMALPYAALAVDFFYVLSGFVVAFAYERKLQSAAVTFKGFLLIRVRRLYPLVALGSLAGIILALAAVVLKHTVTLEQVVVAGALGLLLLPSFVFPQWATAYPFNMASWSLTFEFFVNIVYALVAKWLTTPRLAALTLASAAVLCWVAMRNNGIAGGNNQVGFSYGFGRVMFPFFAGVLIYRMRANQRPRVSAAVVLLATLPILLLIPAPQIPALSLAYVLLIFPALVALGASIDVGPRLTRWCFTLGKFSYPIYILQGPVLRIGEEVLKHRFQAGHPALIFALGEALAVILVAWLAMKFFDDPIQRRFHVQRRSGLSGVA